MNILTRYNALEKYARFAESVAVYTYPRFGAAFLQRRAIEHRGIRQRT
jgi:hypothetical protein